MHMYCMPVICHTCALLLLHCPYAMQGKASKGVKKFVDQKGLIQVSDPAQIEAIVDAVIAANQKQLEQYRAGKTKLQGHFVG